MAMWAESSYGWSHNQLQEATVQQPRVRNLAGLRSYMIGKYLRIAVTALSLTACVLFVALWVRSYSCHDTIGVSATGIYSLNNRIAFTSDPGRSDFLRTRSTSVSSQFLSSINRVANRWGFGSFNSSTFYVYVTPPWFYVLMAGMVAAAPWISWRFSLRTLLIAMTLVAVGLGLVVASS
jgi:hypothetical protein